jgi:hypothetical protein
VLTLDGGKRPTGGQPTRRSTGRPHEPFGKRVRSRRPHGCLDNPGADRPHHLFEGSHELAARSRIRKWTARAWSSRAITRFRAPKWCPTCPRVLTRGRGRRLAHRATSTPFRARAYARIRPVVRGNRRRASHDASVSRCLSATGICLLVILCPPGNWALLTVGLPDPVTRYRAPTGLTRSARTRCGRVGCPLYSGERGAHTAVRGSPAAACRITTAKSLHPGPARILRG